MDGGFALICNLAVKKNPASACKQISTQTTPRYIKQKVNDGNSNKTYNTTDLGESFSKDMSG